MSSTKRVAGIALISLIIALISSPVNRVSAAPSGQLLFEDGDSSEDNQIVVGGSASFEVVFNNTAGAPLSDVASTIQYITLAAANLNPTRAVIQMGAKWRIIPPGLSAARTQGTVTGLETYEVFAPHNLAEPVQMVTWSLGPPSGSLEQYTSPGDFSSDLKILRPGETVVLEVTVQCLGTVGDTRIWLFYRATEHTPTVTPIGELSQIQAESRNNLYYSKRPGPSATPYWWPLHNSYDPYDPDINSGHSYGQHSWERIPTIRAYAKANKDVHQTPAADPSSVIHICGFKFTDTNMDGEMNAGEQGINGVGVTLLGPDRETPAEQAYPGSFQYPPPETNPTHSGENDLQGSYCFNLVDVLDGDYVFYVKADEAGHPRSTTSLLRGPIALTAEGGQVYIATGNDFGNMPSVVVGGELQVPEASRVTHVSLYLALTAALILSLTLKFPGREGRQSHRKQGPGGVET